MNDLTPLPPACSSAEADDAFPIAPDPDEPAGPQWTAPKMAAFLRILSGTHSVSAAARAVGMSRQSAYKLRTRLKGQPFDLAWRCAFRRQYDALAEAALDRALNGVEVPHFHKGELVHTSRRYDERLTVALLAMRLNLAPAPGTREYNVEQLAPDDFEELVDRVENGPETWIRHG
uniref:hypothetical protein n=1 Tax=Altererythrobacter segetis TaxID=1104773 RepID=UPI00140A40CA|nr:hypothetical protein [Altererythrobacter segetis]